MQCKFHPQRQAEVFCAGCNVPLCMECAEESRTGNKYYCFQCATLHTITEVGTSIRDKREKAEERKDKEKKKWGPFRYFVIASSVVILVMWGVVLFGGRKAPHRTIDFSKSERVLLFMANSAIKRYAHYEGNNYPMQLSDLVPTYLSLGEEEAIHLNRLSYRRDPEKGYRLSLAKPAPGEMNLTFTSKGIEYTAPLGGGA
jgi:hypothetical protein